MSFAIAHSRCIVGGHAVAVSVEAHLSNGLPSFTLVGLPETAVRESRDRVRSALLNSGFEFPQRRLTVNLAPGDIPKDGTRFDLAIAVCILAASGQCPAEKLCDTEFVGELALDGKLRPARATVASALAAAAIGRELIVAESEAPTAALIEHACIRGARDLAAVGSHLAGSNELPQHVPQASTELAPAGPDLSEVMGQQQARRALEVAASGAHNLLMLGPPGTGKSMLAARLPGLLPPLSADQAMATAALHSIAGINPNPEYWRQRPFRSPHHSSSAAALVGGGRIPRPGEISLAHNGVLFLDELPEFDRRALECLREPLESGQVTVARAAGSVIFPAAFQLIAAMNPCPCGYAGDPQHACQCTADRIARYRGRVSGPLAERIDIHLELPRQALDFTQPNPRAAESSAAVAARVLPTQQRQVLRQGCLNSDLAGDAVTRFCVMSPPARRLLTAAGTQLGLSARGYFKALKLARTIADMDSAETIEQYHVAESIALRSLDRRNDSGRLQ